MANADFELYPSGVEELCKSEGMIELLRQATEQVKQEANAEVNTRFPDLVAKMDNENFYSKIKTLDHTAIGAVWCGNYASMRAQAEYKSLERQIG